MSATAPGSVILIGPPGAGCSSVARAIGDAQGLPVLDLGRLVADELGTRPDLALVAVPEDAAEPLVSLWPQALRPSARAAVADRVTMCLSVVVLTCCFLVWR